MDSQWLLDGNNGDDDARIRRTDDYGTVALRDDRADESERAEVAPFSPRGLGRAGQGRFLCAVFAILALEFGSAALAGIVALSYGGARGTIELAQGPSPWFSRLDLYVAVWVGVALLSALFLIGRRKTLNRLLVLAFIASGAYAFACATLLYGLRVLPVLVFCGMSAMLFVLASFFELSRLLLAWRGGNAAMWATLAAVACGLLVAARCAFMVRTLHVAIGSGTHVAGLIVGIVLSVLWFAYAIFDARLISQHFSGAEDIWYACVMLHADLFRLVFRI
ncbi:hypothetical protein FVE85_4189 [Porphyridium purpureum]|uniref:Uncharacterized protein n=1 Tax=Porphyridium purpureum TaxID=35688 RepID=A0A5J4YU39_PORPP|nr:hypothetical protein FVE85_4189 [Porphyridium purpureum]|eukprot:POR6882..scf229_5